MPSKDRSGPCVLPGQARYAKRLAEFQRQLFSLADDGSLFRIKMDQRAAQIAQACHAGATTVVTRTKIANVQAHGQPVRITLPLGESDVAVTVISERPVVDLRLGNKLRSAAGQQH